MTCIHLRTDWRSALTIHLPGSYALSRVAALCREFRAAAASSSAELELQAKIKKKESNPQAKP